MWTLSIVLRRVRAVILVDVFALGSLRSRLNLERWLYHAKVKENALAFFVLEEEAVAREGLTRGHHAAGMPPELAKRIPTHIVGSGVLLRVFWILLLDHIALAENLLW